MLVLLLSLQTFVPRNMPIRINKMSTWAAYSLRNEKGLESMIPEGTEIAPIQILANDCPEPKLLFNMYEATSPFFKGRRLEVVTIVRQVKRPEKVHFVVLECLSDTMQWDPIYGITKANAITEFAPRDDRHQLSCEGDTTFFKITGTLGRRRPIARRFAVDANHMCYFRNSSSGVALSFDEGEILQDVQSFFKVRVNTNMWTPFRGRLTHCFVHPHNMNFKVV